VDSCGKREGKNEVTMAQLHKKFSDEQVKAILKNYLDGLMTREHAQDLLGISKSRFFALLGNYRKDPVGMSIATSGKVQKGLA
jgi:uncharacterized protein YejL (UPF0352 family)